MAPRRQNLSGNLQCSLDTQSDRNSSKNTSQKKQDSLLYTSMSVDKPTLGVEAGPFVFVYEGGNVKSSYSCTLVYMQPLTIPTPYGSEQAQGPLERITRENKSNP